RHKGILRTPTNRDRPEQHLFPNPRGRVCLHRWTKRMREIHSSTNDCWIRSAVLGGNPLQRGSADRSPPQDQHGLSDLRSTSLANSPRERRLWPRGPECSETREGEYG